MIYKKGGDLKDSGKNVGDRTGYGSSFKYAIAYYTHDKVAAPGGPQPDTAERVGFVHTVNLPPVPTALLWKEMEFTVNAASKTRKDYARAQAIANGQDPEEAARKVRNTKPLEKPVFTYSLNWHPDERPTPEQMLEKALESLRLLGFEGHQAVIAQHTDEPHDHVHICVNVVNPVTGQAVSPKHDQMKMSRFCFEHELAQGVIHTPDHYRLNMKLLAKDDPERHAKILAMNLPGAPDLDAEAAQITPEAANENATTEPKRKNRNRKDWERGQGVANDNPANAAFTAIKREAAEEWRKIKGASEATYQRQKQERSDEWAVFKAEVAQIKADFKPQFDNVYKRPKLGKVSVLQRISAYAHGDVLKLDDMRRQREWKVWGRQLWEEERDFWAREKTLGGQIINSLQAARVGATLKDQGRLRSAFDYYTNAEARHKMFALRQEQRKKALSDMQFKRRQAIADPIAAKMKAEIEAAAKRRDERLAAMTLRHAEERTAQKAAAGVIRLKTDAAFAAWREEYAIKPKKKRRPRDSFAEAARPYSEEEAARRGRKGGGEKVKIDKEKGVTGVILETGEALFKKRDSDEKGQQVPYVDLRLDDGRTTRLWGVMIPPALKAVGATTGDRVTMRSVKERVTIKAPVKDAATGKTEWKPKEVERNGWNISKEAPAPITQPDVSLKQWEKGGPRHAPITPATPKPKDLFGRNAKDIGTTSPADSFKTNAEDATRPINDSSSAPVTTPAQTPEEVRAAERQRRREQFKQAFDQTTEKGKDQSRERPTPGSGKPRPPK